MIANILGMEDPFMGWILAYAPSLGICIILVWMTAWITSKFAQFDHRVTKVETEVGELKADMKVVKKRLSRIEWKVSRLEAKLDLLISHLITKKQVDKDVLS